jgi:hypothetical protein
MVPHPVFSFFSIFDVTQVAIIPKMIWKFENMKVKSILASFHIFGYLLELRIGSGDSINYIFFKNLATQKLKEKPLENHLFPPKRKTLPTPHCEFRST